MVVILIQILNAVIKFWYFPTQWKFAYSSFSGKSLNETSLRRPISPLVILSKIFENLLLKWLKSVILFEIHCEILRTTFYNEANTSDSERNSIEENKVCLSAFIDISRAFDRVWHEGLYKIKHLPRNYYLPLSLLPERYSPVNYNGSFCKLYPIRAAMPQGSVLGLALHHIFIAHLATTSHARVVKYADDNSSIRWELGQSNRN